MVSLTEGQKATISPEAAAYLAGVHHLPFASLVSHLVTSPSRVPRLRRALEEKTAPGEDELIRRHRLQITEMVIAGVPVTVIEPPPEKDDGKPRRVLFNVFGGAFVMGSPRDRAALTMAAELGVRVYSVGYARAPEARYPVARDQCLAVYRELCAETRGLDHSEMYAMGCSSGAQLLVSTLLVARREGLPMPRAGVYLCAPALDLSGAGDSMVTNAHDRDLMPVSLLSGMVSQNYAGDADPRDPLYSPIYAGDADQRHGYGPWFPPTVITVGTRDFALSHGVRFYWKLRRAGCARVELLVSEGMWHGFNWDPVIPEALEVRAAVVAFLEGGV